MITIRSNNRDYDSILAYVKKSTLAWMTEYIDSKKNLLL